MRLFSIATLVLYMATIGLVSKAYHNLIQFYSYATCFLQFLEKYLRAHNFNYELRILMGIKFDELQLVVVNNTYGGFWSYWLLEFNADST